MSTTPGNDGIAAHVRGILAGIGEDPDREGLQKTPERVEKALQFLTAGYQQTVEEAIGGALFEERHESMILVRDIELYSLCEHHMLPFFGRAHVAYIPHGRIMGLVADDDGAGAEGAGLFDEQGGAVVRREQVHGEPAGMGGDDLQGLPAHRAGGSEDADAPALLFVHGAGCVQKAM